MSREAEHWQQTCHKPHVIQKWQLRGVAMDNARIKWGAGLWCLCWTAHVSVSFSDFSLNFQFCSSFLVTGLCPDCQCDGYGGQWTLLQVVPTQRVPQDVSRDATEGIGGVHT